MLFSEKLCTFAWLNSTKLMAMAKLNSVLLVFTGGTISMSEDSQTGALRPFDFSRVKEYLPELQTLGIHVDTIPFEPLIDSSDVQPTVWSRLAHIVEDNYNDYDGFVILHGTDTMAYSASALSFMLKNLTKPVIFTGSQLPIGMMRSDAKENLLTAIEIALATDEQEHPIVPEVCIFFEDKLFRGNRTTKKNAEHFNAFESYNYPHLAKAGVHIKYYESSVRYPEWDKPLSLRTNINQNVAILKLFPGITEQTVDAFLSIPDLKAVVLETFGSGNAPSRIWFRNALKLATQRGIIIVNKTQCHTGSVEMGRYETSLNLLDAGVLSGYDITTEALVAKLMYLLGEYPNDTQKVRKMLTESIAGEMTIPEK